MDSGYQVLIDQAPILIWRSGKDALCDYFNDRWLDFTGRTLEQELGNGWAEGVHPDDYDRCLEIYMGSFKKRKTFEMNYRLKRHDGEYRWLFDRGGPYFEDGEFAGYIGACVDITERIEMESEKEKAYNAAVSGAEQIVSRLLNKVLSFKDRIKPEDKETAIGFYEMLLESSFLLAKLSNVNEMTEEAVKEALKLDCSDNQMDDQTESPSA